MRWPQSVTLTSLQLPLRFRIRTMDRHTIQTLASASLALICLGGTVAIAIIGALENRPANIPDVLVNLDFVAGTAFFVNAAVQNGARSAGMAAAQTAVTAAGKTPGS